ncbi:hypothetical protein D9757_014227, partial [Collybiopsis confluens]
MNETPSSPLPSSTPLSDRITEVRKEARTTLLKAGWLSGDMDNASNILNSLIGLASTYLNKSTGPSTRAKNPEGWDKVKAVGICLRELWEAQRAELLANKMRREEKEDEGLSDKVVKVVAAKLDFHLEKLTGKAMSLSISDEPAFTQIIADQVQRQFETPLKKVEEEAKAALAAADRIMARGQVALQEATKRLEESTQTIKKLEERMLGTNGSGGEDGVVSEANAALERIGVDGATNGQSKIRFVSVTRSKLGRVPPYQIYKGARAQ